MKRRIRGRGGMERAWHDKEGRKRRGESRGGEEGEREDEEE